MSCLKIKSPLVVKERFFALYLCYHNHSGLNCFTKIKQFLCQTEALQGKYPAFHRTVGWARNKAGLYEAACHGSEPSRPAISSFRLATALALGQPLLGLLASNCL